MQEQFLKLYEDELRFLREAGQEFAQTHQRVAARLGLGSLEHCPDPYIERLLEGFAFLTAHVQWNLRQRFPELTQQLLESVYPGFLHPIPSCAVVELSPDRTQGSLQSGFVVPRGSVLRTAPIRRQPTQCEFRTAHEVNLWPIELIDAKYLMGAGGLRTLGIGVGSDTRAALRVRLKTANGIPFSQLPMASLTLHLKADSAIAGRLYEQLTMNVIDVQLATSAGTSTLVCREARVAPAGFDDGEALLPQPRAGFTGYRLLQEYFALPERFLFVRIDGLQPALGDIRGDTLDLYLTFDKADEDLERSLQTKHLRLHCTPVANLFPMELDRVTVSPTAVEHLLTPDRNRPNDFEVAGVEHVGGVTSGEIPVGEVPPLYRLTDTASMPASAQYYAIRRRARVISTQAERVAGRASYLGTECFLSLSRAIGAEAAPEIRYLDVRALCTNRDLPVLFGGADGALELMLDGSAPVASSRCITGPTRPRESAALDGTAWRLINHLAVNLRSISDASPTEGAELLRRFLRLHANSHDPGAQRQISGVESIAHRPIVRRLPTKGPIAFGRGLGIELRVDEAAFGAGGAVLFAAVLERFFARYVSINSFTELSLHSSKRGRIRTWPARFGRRVLL